MHCMVDKLVDAFVFHRRNRHHGNAKRSLELVDAHRAAVGAKLVHHVQRKHHRNIELHELQREIKIAFDIGRVNDIDNGRRLLIDEEIARDHLFARVGR